MSIWIALAVQIGAAFWGVTAPSLARAELVISPDDIEIEVLNAAGEPETRAGAHPDRFVALIGAGGGPAAGEDIKDMVIDFPAGFGGDPSAVPKCSRAVFEGLGLFGEECPAASQVGVTEIVESGETTQSLPVYALDSGPDEAAVFGVSQSLTRIKLVGRLRPGDQGLSLTLENLAQGQSASASKTRFVFWGVPADHQEGTGIPRRALLANPTRCGAPVALTLHARTWQEPGRWATATQDTGEPLVGCEDLAFAPRVGLALGNPSVDSPSGVQLDVIIPQNDDPDGRVPSQTQRIALDLPDGMSFAPGAVAGLTACSDAQFGRGTDAEVRCPPSSRIGTMEVAAPQLANAISGGIYIGDELPGERFRIFVAAGGAGTQVKLIGSLQPDPVTGRLSTVLDGLPQVAFGRMTMRFDGGPRALLATPLSCGPATLAGTFTPFSGAAAVTSSTAVAMRGIGGSRCPDRFPFEPGFVAGGSVLGGGRPTSFSMTLSRRDGEQLPDRFDVTLPRGLSAALGSVKLCAADAAAGRCPGESRVGSSVAEVGSGPNPAPLTGGVYLTGPYRRAPFGLAITFGAALGPFDLGSVVVRSALRLDPRSGQVTVALDALPRLVAGVPIRFQTIGMDIDRPGFMRNPTSCTSAGVAATITSTEGAVFRVRSPLALRGCVSLPFRPSFSLGLTKRAELRRDGRPGFDIAVRAPKRGANLRRVDIQFPEALALNSSGPDELCARGEALKGACPAGSRVGGASARSPLLAKRLRGSIYVAQPADDGPPDLWTSLEGQGIEMNLRSETVATDGELHAKLASLPDTPLAALKLSFAAGRKGLFSLDQGLCVDGRPRRLSSVVSAEGQNSARLRVRVPVLARPDCGGARGG